MEQLENSFSLQFEKCKLLLRRPRLDIPFNYLCLHFWDLP